MSIKNIFLTVPLLIYTLYKKNHRKYSKKRVLHHLTQNSLLNLYQSAYCKYYCTEATLLSLHVHLTNAISINKYPAFAFWISLPPSTPSAPLSYSIVVLLGSAFRNYPCNGLPNTYHPAHQQFSSHLISLLLNLSFSECHISVSFSISTEPFQFVSELIFNLIEHPRIYHYHRAWFCVGLLAYMRLHCSS